jgi:molybdate transport system ATP-binding protein
MNTRQPNRVRARFKLNYPGFALDVDLDLPGRGVTALFGPSGSGKTSCLRTIAGLARHAQGADAYVAVNGKVWQDDARNLFRPVHQRALGYVFQDANLFTHLSVAQNVAYGMKRVVRALHRVSLDQVVHLLGIGHLMDRRPGTLSGGERQRVAIARALATSPRILLLDEPLAALDAQRKAEVLPYLERLHSELDIPVLYVSHALEEVTRLADHLVLLEAGRVMASGPMSELITRLDLSLAHGDTAGAIIRATVSGHEPVYHLTVADFPGGHLCVPQQMMGVGQAVRIRVQARDVSLTLEPQTGTSILNILPAKVVALSDESAGQVMVKLDAGGTPLLARITRKSVDALGLVAGRAVYAQVKGVAILRP